MASIWSRIYLEDRHLDTVNFIRDAYRSIGGIVEGVRGVRGCGALLWANDSPSPEEPGNI